MKTLVVYYSRTGTTKKVTEAVFSVLTREVVKNEFLDKVEIFLNKISKLA